jgi:serine/threonine protein kinase
MRCLRCKYEGIEDGEESCPRCKTFLPPLMRDMLPRGAVLENGKYRLNYPLGRGGFGITYHAHHIGFDRPVAIKEFFPHQSAMRDGSALLISIDMPQQNDYFKALDRFMKEGRTLYDLAHPNVIRVHDLFRFNNTAYIVMELIIGRTLREILDASLDKQLPSKQVEIIVEQIISALDTIHKRKICHLDISPDNIMIDEKGRVVLIDFGAAKQIFKVVHSTFAFKQPYTPLELITESNFGPESDIFELSMMIYEMLTGKLPPPSLQRATTIDNWLPTDVPDNWRKILLSGLQLRREDRPKNIKQWWDGFNKSRLIIGKRVKGKMVLGNGKRN